MLTQRYGVYTNKQMSKALGLRKSTVSFYTDKKIIVPEISNPSGRGTTRKYSRRNCVEVLLIKQVTASGIPLGLVDEIMDTIRNVKSTEGFDALDPYSDDERQRSMSMIVIKMDNDDIVYKFTTKSVEIGMDKVVSAKVINVSRIVDHVKNLFNT